MDYKAQIGAGVFGAFGGVAAARSGNRMPFTGAQPGFDVSNITPMPGSNNFVGPLPKLRIPGAKWGTFEGVPGYSDFLPSNPTALGLKPGDRINWQGVPNFAQYGTSVEVKGLTGNPSSDRDLAINALARQRNISVDSVRKWLTQDQLRLHHYMGDEMQVVPAQLHRIPHQGSASLLRNGQ